MKLTDWFPPEVKPVRVGVYERKFGSSENCGLCKWNGKAWFWRCKTPFDASTESVKSGFQELPWRGLTENPEKAK
jgi:hypothetical protein